MAANDLISMVHADLLKQIRRNEKGLALVHNVTEQSQYVDGIPAYTFANLPTSGLANGTSYITLAWVTDGCKSGETAGNGTGVLAVYNPSTATWKRVGEDYNDVTI